MVATVVVPVTLPVGLDTHVVPALEQEGGAIGAVGEARRWEESHAGILSIILHNVNTFITTV